MANNTKTTVDAAIMEMTAGALNWSTNEELAELNERANDRKEKASKAEAAKVLAKVTYVPDFKISVPVAQPDFLDEPTTFGEQLAALYTAEIIKTEKDGKTRNHGKIRRGKIDIEDIVQGASEYWAAKGKSVSEEFAASVENGVNSDLALLTAFLNRWGQDLFFGNGTSKEAKKAKEKALEVANKLFHTLSLYAGMPYPIKAKNREMKHLIAFSMTASTKTTFSTRGIADVESASDADLVKTMHKAVTDATESYTINEGKLLQAIFTLFHYMVTRKPMPKFSADNVGQHVRECVENDAMFQAAMAMTDAVRYKELEAATIEAGHAASADSAFGELERVDEALEAAEVEAKARVDAKIEEKHAAMATA